MKELDAASFVDLVQAVGAVRGVLGLHPETILAGSAKETLRSRMEHARSLCEGIRLPYSVISIDRLLKLVSGSQELKGGTLERRLDDLTERIIDEFEAMQIFVLNPDVAGLYTNVEPFGSEVALAFPSVRSDAEEAAKCLAVARGTAAVFHLMRVLELTIRILMKDMGEPYDPRADTDWSKMLAKCNQHVSGAPDEKKQFYRDAVTMLTSVKFSWRNNTMHPKNLYTEEEAHDVWTSVHVFVRHLATELTE